MRKRNLPKVWMDMKTSCHAILRTPIVILAYGSKPKYPQ